LEAQAEAGYDGRTTLRLSPSGPEASSILRDAEQRVLFLQRQRVANAEATKLLSKERSGEEGYQKVIAALTKAMVHPASDPEPLRAAISDFLRLPSFAQFSTAAQALLRRARALEALWSRRRRCMRARVALRDAVREALKEEVGRRERDARRVALLRAETEAKIAALRAAAEARIAAVRAGGDAAAAAAAAPPLAELGPVEPGQGGVEPEEPSGMESLVLAKAFEQAWPFRGELEFELAVAMAVLERRLPAGTGLDGSRQAGEARGRARGRMPQRAIGLGEKLGWWE